ncbi:hypothetical protein Dimus_037171, partial [Dionaea muscipula]
SVLAARRGGSMLAARRRGGAARLRFTARHPCSHAAARSSSVPMPVARSSPAPMPSCSELAGGDPPCGIAARARGRPSSARRLLRFTARARGGLLIGCLRTPHAQQAGARMHGQLVLDDGRETHATLHRMLMPMRSSCPLNPFECVILLAMQYAAHSIVASKPARKGNVGRSYVEPKPPTAAVDHRDLLLRCPPWLAARRSPKVVAARRESQCLLLAEEGRCSLLAGGEELLGSASLLATHALMRLLGARQSPCQAARSSPAPMPSCSELVGGDPPCGIAARARGRPSSARRLLRFTARARGGLLIGCLRTPHAQQAGARMHGQLVLDDGRETHVWWPPHFMRATYIYIYIYPLQESFPVASY